jgi:hypothetical protein
MDVTGFFLSTKGLGLSHITLPGTLCLPSSRYYTEDPLRVLSQPLEGSSSQVPFSSWSKKTAKKKESLLMWSDSA